jgi:CRISPR-associated protein (TIGR02584 family)
LIITNAYQWKEPVLFLHPLPMTVHWSLFIGMERGGETGEENEILLPTILRGFDGMKKKHTLVAIVGMTPQVVTETLYGLIVKKCVCIEDVYVVTTREGKNAVLGIPSDRYSVSLKDAIERLASAYGFTPPAFDPEHHVLVAQEESVELHDIRSDRENRLFPNLIVDLLRRKSEEPDGVLHCSIAGGRKSMSLALAAALSIFGRRDDKLYHVLVSKQLEESGKFFPERPDEDTELVLSEIPYVRLRGLLDLQRLADRRSYMDIVDFAQENLDRLMAGPFLEIDLPKRQLRIGNQTIDLQPKELAVYVHYLLQKTAILGGEKGYSTSQATDVIRVYCKVAVTEGHKARGDESLRKWTSVNKAITGVNKKLHETLGSGSEEFKIRQNKKYGANTYEIRLDRSRVADLDGLKRMF